MFPFVIQIGVARNDGTLRDAVVRRAVRLRPGSLEQRDGERSGAVGLDLGRLVDRSGLPAGDDVLSALGGSVLTGHRDRRQLLRLERRHDRVREAVVRRGDRVDLVTGLDEHLLEDRPCLLVVPGRHALIRALGRLAVLDQLVEDACVALLEELRVVVRRASVEVGDDGLLPAPSRLFFFMAATSPAPMKLADRGVVERDVVVGALAARVEAVVVDDLRAARLGVLDDLQPRSRVEARHEDDLGAVGEALVGLRAPASGRHPRRSRPWPRCRPS